MENVKRFIFIACLLAVSMVFIHTSKAPQKIDANIRVACFPLALAQQIDTDVSLKWNAKIAYDTLEDDKTQYRCYLSFPQADSVVCTPKKAANRQDLNSCPNYPALKSKTRTCYFLNKKHYALADKLKKENPRMNMKDLNGVIVQTIDEAKKILAGKK